MPNQYGVPEISPAVVAERRNNGDQFLLVDVREPDELQMANLGDGVLLLPLSQLAAQRLEAIPAEMENRDQEIVVFCHHGARSAQVVAFLQAHGWTNVINMDGGIHSYALTVNRDVGMY